MAVIKQRLCRKGSSNTYDTIHLETSAGAVLMANGTTVETAINGKANSNHTHSGYAASNHTHSGYASSSHSHSFSSISGNLTSSQIAYIKSQVGSPQLYQSGDLANLTRVSPSSKEGKSQAYLTLNKAAKYVRLWTRGSGSQSGNTYEIKLTPGAEFNNGASGDYSYYLLSSNGMRVDFWWQYPGIGFSYYEAYA